MPIYEYKCAECGKHIERMQKISDEPLTVCETCGGKLEKQWSLSGFQFKGAGWYVSDYSDKLKDPNAAKPAKAGKAEKSDKAEKTEKTSVESTVKTESASNTSNDTATTAPASSVKEANSKND